MHIAILSLPKNPWKSIIKGIGNMANKKGRAIIKSSEKPISKIRNFDTELFKWSFKSYYSEHKCWCELGGNDVITNIIHKLEDYSTQTWSEVKSASGGKREGNGSNSTIFQLLNCQKTIKRNISKMDT